MNSSACASVLCIFQLPAISGVRAPSSTPPPRHSSACDARQRAALDQLERRAAAGREVVDRVLQAEVGERRGRVAAADDGQPRARRPPPGRPRACRRRTARARRRPSGRSRRPCRRPRSRWRSARAVRGPDVEAHPAVGHVDAVELAVLGVGGEAVADDEVAGSSRRAWRGAPPGRAAPRACSMSSASHSESPTACPWAREEREAHRAADQDRVGELQEALDHADLVGHLRAADDRDERPRGVLEDAR